MLLTEYNFLINKNKGAAIRSFGRLNKTVIIIKDHHADKFRTQKFSPRNIKKLTFERPRPIYM